MRGGRGSNICLSMCVGVQRECGMMLGVLDRAFIGRQNMKALGLMLFSFHYVFFIIIL